MLNIILMMFSLKLRTVVFIKPWMRWREQLRVSTEFQVLVSTVQEGETRGIQLVAIADLKDLNPSKSNNMRRD